MIDGEIGTHYETEHSWVVETRGAPAWPPPQVQSWGSLPSVGDHPARLAGDDSIRCCLAASSFRSRSAWIAC
jgi:hypothetical protein